MMCKYAIPYLKKGTNPHILNLSPPLNMDPKWFGQHLAYTISKYNMSQIAMGLANELKEDGVAANTLWPKTTIATAAVKFALGGEKMIQHSRTPEIMADAAFHILSKPSQSCTGNFFIDEEVVLEAGITDLDKYAVDTSKELLLDLFL